MKPISLFMLLLGLMMELPNLSVAQPIVPGPCSTSDYRATSAEGRLGIATCDGSDSYMFHTYVQNQDINFAINYGPGNIANGSNYRIKITHEYKGVTTDVTDDNSSVWNQPSGYHYTFDTNPFGFYTLRGNLMVAQGPGRYKLDIQVFDQVWQARGVCEVYVIPKIERIWLEANPICENTYLQNTSSAPDNNFKIKTEPALQDIFFGTYFNSACFEVEAGYFDVANSYANINGILTNGFSACNTSNLAWSVGLNSASLPDYSIDGSSMSWFFNNASYPSPLQIKVKFDDQVVNAPLQIVMPLIINTSSANIANNLNPNGAGPAFHDYDYVVNGKEVWTPTNNPIFWRNNPGAPSTATTPSYNTYRLQHNLIITPGSFLTIKDMNIEFGPNARVIVQANPGTFDYGGRLRLDNSKLMSYYGGGCSNVSNIMWAGITVQGNSSRSQLFLPPNAYGAINYQGFLQIENGTNIMNAYDAVKLWDGSGSTGGGIVRAKNSSFTNNKRAVEFEIYTGGGSLASNQSFFQQCNFITNKVLPSPFYAFISGWAVKNVSIDGCVFWDFAQDPNATNYGIHGGDASFIIDKYGSGSNLPTSFWGLRKAIQIDDITGISRLSVKNSQFDNNGLGVVIAGSIAPRIIQNDMNIPSGNQNVGVLLLTSSGYTIKNNNFQADAANLNSGVVVSNSGGAANKIESNSYSSLFVGNLSNFINRNSGSATHGLKFHCNNHSNNVIDMAAKGTLTGTTPSDNGISIDQGSNNMPAGNRFSIPFTGHSDIENPGNEVGSINYYYNPSEPQTTPNLISGSVTTIPISKLSGCSETIATTGGSSTSYPAKASYIYDRIQEFMFGEDSTSRDSLYYWVGKWTSPYGRLLETDLLMEDGETNRALAMYNSILASDELTAIEVEEFTFGKRLLDIRIALHTAGRTIKELEATQVQQISIVADSAKAWAKTRAQNWLSLYDGRTFSHNIIWPQGGNGPSQRKTAVVGRTQKVYPNPAKESITVSYENESEDGGTFEIVDVTGRVLQTTVLQGISGETMIQLQHLASGVYIYRFMEHGNVTNKGKFVKQ